MSMYMCTHMKMHVHVHVGVLVYVYVYVCARAYIYIYVYAYACVYVDVHTCMYKYTDMHALGFCISIARRLFCKAVLFFYRGFDAPIIELLGTILAICTKFGQRAI